jgi:hypothetical protein
MAARRQGANLFTVTYQRYRCSPDERSIAYSYCFAQAFFTSVEADYEARSIPDSPGMLNVRIIPRRRD